MIAGRTICGYGLIASVAFAMLGCAGPDQTTTARNTDQPRLSASREQAIEQGLTWLAKHPLPNGVYGLGSEEGHVGISSIAGLAFLGAGSMPNEGKYGQQLDRILTFVLKSQDDAGGFAQDSTAAMYSHGYGTLFLTQVYALTDDAALRDRLREPIIRALAFTEKAQNPQGGWRYTPDPLTADISVTSSQLMAMDAAMRTGFDIDRMPYQRGVQYVQRCHIDGEGFSYMAGPRGQSGWARTAAGVAVLRHAGLAQQPEVQESLEYLRRMEQQDLADTVAFYFYGSYYRTQVALLAGQAEFNDWYDDLAQGMIRRQNPDGSWQGEVGPHYATATALVALQMPNRTLPAFRPNAATGTAAASRQ